MRYLVCKTFNKNGIGGSFNLLKGATINRVEDKLYHNGREICFISSQYAHDYFSRNDDEQGTLRFELSHNIITKIIEANMLYNECEDSYKKDHSNPIFAMYGAIRENYPAFIKEDDDILTYEFFDASIYDLNIIKVLIDSVELPTHA